VVGLPLSPEAVPACVAHVDEAIRLALTPLAAAARGLREDAFVLFVSSAAMTRSQRLWPHYVAAKAALEGLAGHTAQHHPGWRVAVARPPRMRTEMANGPASAFGAVPPGAAAAAIIARLLSAAATPGQVQFIDGAAIAHPTTAR
jgi:NAD(P)-dependent dehydrogenase (short-subunit alcohol dehydrogenase family)